MATSSVFSGGVTADSLSLAVGTTGTKTVGGRMFASIADSATLVLPGTATTNAFLTTFSLPANTLVSGSTLRVRLVTRVTVVTAVSTVAIVLRLGGTTMGTSQQVVAAQANGVRCVIDAVFTARGAPGAAVGLSGVATAVWSGLPAVVTAYPDVSITAVPTFATNAALVIDAATISGGLTTGSLVIEELVVYVD